MLTLLAPTAAIFGQTLTDMTGVITDTSGAVMPGVTARVPNLGNSVSTIASRNEDGIYRILYLQPVQYQLEAEHAGFRGFVRGPITSQYSIPLELRFALKLAW